MDQTHKFHCTIVTPEAAILDIDLWELVVPAHDGLLGIMYNHAPLLVKLATGNLRYKDLENKSRQIFIAGGFCHVLKNEVTILSWEAIMAKDISEAKAKEKLLEAQTLPMKTMEQVETRSAAIFKAQCLLRLNQKV